MSWLDEVDASATPSPSPLKKKTEEEKAAAKEKSSSSSSSGSKKRELPKQYAIERWEDIPEPEVFESSVFKTGWAKGSFVAVLGPPGGGKSRFLIQEALHASLRGEDVLYMYNETAKQHFNPFVKRVVQSMGHSDASSVEHITWVDMGIAELGTADFDSIKHFVKSMWTSQIDYWLNTRGKNPSFIFLDSFSRMARRFVPQMWQANAQLLEQFEAVYEAHEVSPVTFIVNQKSQSSKERDDDSVVGGYGIVHEYDITLLMKINQADKWAADRYGVPEGTIMHTVQFGKNRTTDEAMQERMINLDKDGTLKLGANISDLVAAEKTKKDQKYKRGSRSDEDDDPVNSLWGDKQ